MKELFVYILKCSDNSYYVGLANKVNKRFEEHQLGLHVHSNTYSRRPIELIWFNKFNSALEAIECEKKIKGWTRKKKEALINGDFGLLKNLSECKNETIFKNYVKQASTPLSLTVNK